MMLKLKLKCYDKHQQKPDEYYHCIDELDKIMSHNSKQLQQKFGQLDVSPIEREVNSPSPSLVRERLLDPSCSNRDIIVLLAE